MPLPFVVKRYVSDDVYSYGVYRFESVGRMRAPVPRSIRPVVAGMSRAAARIECARMNHVATAPVKVDGFDLGHMVDQICSIVFEEAEGEDHRIDLGEGSIWLRRGMSVEGSVDAWRKTDLEALFKRLRLKSRVRYA
jgi:hypothetical protein